MLNTFHLRTFLAVVEAGTYSAAAEQLHMTQPAVSQQIKVLEEQLGDIRLFRRVGQRMVPTHAGEMLVSSARELVGLAEKAQQSILALKGQVVGRVVVGCTASSGECFAPPLLAAFRQQFPEVVLTVEVARSDTLLQALANQQVTLLLFEEYQRRRGWESHLLGREPLALVAPGGHALLQQERVPPGVLREQALVLPQMGSPLRRAIDEGLRRNDVASSGLNIATEAESVATLIQSVRSGLGLAFVPQSRLPPLDGALGVIDLAGSPLYQDWYVLRVRERSIPRAAHELYAFLTSVQAHDLLGQFGLQFQTET